ncbi:GLPGLI family protein [Psychroflexus montanilacus]|uniref:GLPGLI family protein n=1 Tax=Psychroflexus montanilacus TaxID=2873598 RepID=UPI001CCB48D3|nr:GLPGLI family protein [Psychroflexus montanilacus]MBZ9652429.1 GLPGLI family protein [Psychroflexus montanilacus]
MNKLLVLLLITLSNTYAQENTQKLKVVDYTLEQNFDLSSTKKSILTFNSTQSKYQEEKGDIKAIPENAQVRDLSGSNSTFYNVNLKDRTLKMKTQLDGETMIVKEDLPAIEWNIKPDSTREIMGFNCIEAEAVFRGRFYTAWFSPEIPVPFGPWKLQGLPGLILEAYDKMDEVHFYATQLKYEQGSLKELNISNENDVGREISLKDYIELRQKDVEKQLAKILAALPRDTKVSNIKTSKYKGLELEYPWDN